MYYICQTLSSGIARTSGNTGFVIRQPPLHPAGALHVVADLRQRLFAQYQPREHDVEVNVFGLRIGVTHDGDGQYPGALAERVAFQFAHGLDRTAELAVVEVAVLALEEGGHAFAADVYRRGDGRGSCRDRGVAYVEIQGV